jgi:hypothetical protein
VIEILARTLLLDDLLDIIFAMLSWRVSLLGAIAEISAFDIMIFLYFGFLNELRGLANKLGAIDPLDAIEAVVVHGTRGGWRLKVEGGWYKIILSVVNRGPDVQLCS